MDAHYMSTVPISLNNAGVALPPGFNAHPQPEPPRTPLPPVAGPGATNLWQQVRLQLTRAYILIVWLLDRVSRHCYTHLPLVAKCMLVYLVFYVMVHLFRWPQCSAVAAPLSSTPTQPR